jgi:hypothetical protein
MSKQYPYAICVREQFEVNIDPQRRCYYGTPASSEWVWGEWEELGAAATEEDANASVASWKEVTKDTGRRLEYKWVKKEEK